MSAVGSIWYKLQIAWIATKAQYWFPWNMIDTRVIDVSNDEIVDVIQSGVLETLTHKNTFLNSYST